MPIEAGTGCGLARALGLDVHNSLQLLASEVIE